jgi:hypothetical protein
MEPTGTNLRHDCNYQLGKKFYQDALDSGAGRRIDSPDW